MEQTEIVNHILRHLYTIYFSERGAASIRDLCVDYDLENSELDKLTRTMKDEGLIKVRYSGGYYGITPHGILEAESLGILTEEELAENADIRHRTLVYLAEIHEQKEYYIPPHVQTVAKDLDIDVHRLVNNMQFLNDAGHLEDGGTGFRISSYGLDAVREWREHIAFLDRYEEMSSMQPQQRGREFQKVFGKVIEDQGWLQEEGVRTSTEEMDVIVHRGREYFLIECKWEKGPIGASVVRELYGKLDNRANINGILVSMSGFTDPAVEQAEKYSSKQLILFWGAGDLEELLYRRRSFEDLVADKYHLLVSKNKITYE